MPETGTPPLTRTIPPLIALIAILIVPTLVAADGDLLLKLQTDKDAYRAGDTMIITANLTLDNKPILANITFQVDDPAGAPILIFTKPTDNGTARIIIMMDYNATTGVYQVYGSAKVENISLSANRALDVKPYRGPPVPRKADTSWTFMASFLILMILGLALAYVAGRRRAGRAAEKTEEEKAAYEERGREFERVVPSTPAGSSPPAALEAPRETAQGPAPVSVALQFLVDEVFLVYRDGRLIAHETRRLSPKDADVVTSMFTAVQQFVKESFADDAELGSLEIGESEVLLERGSQVFLAAVVKGTPPGDYRETMKGAIRDIEAQYSAILRSWDGTLRSFAGAKKMLLPLFDAATEGVPERRTEVELSSAVEFFQGYIRMKVAVKNATRSVITGVEFEPLYDEDVFKLVKLEPDYPYRKGRIDFGVMNPGIKKTVALFLEPVICTECFIEGTLRYKDSQGELHSEILKKKKVEVVCPIFYTEENINTAMLRRLISEELTQQDSRIYLVENTDRSYTIAKEVVRGRQVRLVRELADDKGLDWESWFYGLTQDRKHKIVIKVSIKKPTRMLEVFVATPGKLMLTGCLAELGRDVAGRLEREGLLARQLTDMARKEQVLRETLSLIEKYSEAEADAGDTDQ